MNQTTLIEIRPQEGPQEEFLSCSADIVLYGGAAGGGKTFGLLIEPLRHKDNPKFGGVIFRRNTTQARNEGGLWDESMGVYPLFKGHPRKDQLSWVFPSGSRMKFAHLEYEETVLDWQGSAIAYMGFDELTHFTEKQFFYMISRNRSVSGIRPYIRATCNPDADSWVRKFIDWWIGEDGFPIKERAGVVRWFIRIDDKIIWAASRQELLDLHGQDQLPKSFTFIPSSVYDNKILLSKDPGYVANLKSLPRVERMRLLGGNWNVRPTAGDYFQREMFEVIDALPAGHIQAIRYWDKAATKPNENNKDPDWTRGAKMLRYPNGIFVVAHLASTRDSPLKVETLVKNTASQDTHSVMIGIEQEPGSAGVADAANYVRLLAGYNVRVRKPTTDKVTRALPLSAQAEQGNIKVLRGDWNEDFFSEMENFAPDCAHDDIVDACTGAFNELCGGASILDVL